MRIHLRCWTVTCLACLGSRLAMGQAIYACPHTRISFFSSAPLEDISAISSQGVSAIDLKTGAVYFRVPVSSFEFPNRLMQAHFNAHYLETDRYPDAGFTGRLTIFPVADTARIEPVEVFGTLTIHGVSMPCRTRGVLELKGGELGINAAFRVKLTDYHIQVPRLLVKNIAEEVDVNVSAVYQTGRDSAGVATLLGIPAFIGKKDVLPEDSAAADSSSRR